MAALRAAAPSAKVEVTGSEGPRTGVLLQTTPGEAPLLGSGLLRPILAHQGIDAVVDPVVARNGRLHVRVTIPREVEPHEVLRALQSCQKAGGSAEFRIARIAPLSPDAHVEMARRALSPEQEGLLALAASMGYYATPKVVTLERIASVVGLSISPVHKKLKASEEAIVARYLAKLVPESPRRRARRSEAAGAGPWEVQVRAREDEGIGAALVDAPRARASIHGLMGDAESPGASLLVLVAAEDTQRSVIRRLEERADVDSVSMIGRSGAHVACRLVARDDGLYSLPRWNEAWGGDGGVRAIMYERGEARVRAVLTTRLEAGELDARAARVARVAGWSEWEVEAVRSLADDLPPPEWPEPLTHRQEEVLHVAHALGYYQTPRGCTLEDVAKTLHVSANAVHKNLVLAESKLIRAYLAAGL